MTKSEYSVSGDGGKLNGNNGTVNPSFVVEDEENGHRMTNFDNNKPTNGSLVGQQTPGESRRPASKSLITMIGDKLGLDKYSNYISLAFKAALFLAFHIYIIVAIVYHVRNELDILWCDGLGIVLIIMIITYAYKIGSFVFDKLSRTKQYQDAKDKAGALTNKIMGKMWARISVHALCWTFMFIFLLVDAFGDINRVISVAGIAILIGLGAIFSKHPKNISWRQVTWGTMLQFLMALFILRWKTGQLILQCLGNKVERFLSFTDDGSGFMYGYLVTQKPFIPQRLPADSIAFNVTSEINAAMAVPSIVTFKAISVVYFFSFIVNILFYYGIIQSMTRGLGKLLKLTINTTACESLNAAANIFLGQALSPLLIKPYLPSLSLSEIHSVMASGFATIAGVVMAAYISFGVDPGHLLAASVMSAPAALAYAKLIYPETEPTSDETMIDKTDEELKEEDAAAKDNTNLLAEATKGATDGAVLVMNIVGIVIACIAMISFMNALVSFFFGLVGCDYINFEWFLGWIFTPLAFILGIEWRDCRLIGKLIGVKTVVNEFIAYKELGAIISAGEGQLTLRSQIIATYALCGFANPACVGIQLATLCSMCPERKKEYSLVVFRSFVAGVAACLMTACFAGALLQLPDEEPV